MVVMTGTIFEYALHASREQLQHCREPEAVIAVDDVTAHELDAMHDALGLEFPIDADLTAQTPEHADAMLCKLCSSEVRQDIPRVYCDAHRPGILNPRNVTVGVLRPEGERMLIEPARFMKEHQA